jgi:nicotinate-nucleotide pyrophosphorylase (carboxylating)
MMIDQPDFHFGEPEGRAADTLIRLALAEDFGEAGDITSTATIPSAGRARARLVSRAAGILAGLPVALRLAEQFELIDQWRTHRADGDRLEPGSLIAEIAGPARSVLAIERTVLNFLQRLSGIATLTARYVAEVAGTGARILDTRKTTPGWRVLEKYAVRCGGGHNHRMGLFDAILIKDNHLAFLRAQGGSEPIAASITASRAHAPDGAIVEIEVDTLEQLDLALCCRADIILVDNLGPEGLAQAVSRRDSRAPGVELEASGGVSLASVAALARTGVDRISVGALTHSAPALDIAMDLDVAVR